MQVVTFFEFIVIAVITILVYAFIKTLLNK